MIVPNINLLVYACPLPRCRQTLVGRIDKRKRKSRHTVGRIDWIREINDSSEDTDISTIDLESH